MFKQLYSEELKKLLSNAENGLTLLDVRQPYEHDEFHIPNSILIPLNELPERLAELEQYKNAPIVVYCKAGVRSAMACKFLAAHGFDDLTNLADGVMGW
ncbi:MAG: rhodanese-like domain-containing protein [Neisseriales bacterium]|nr:MAG: rhodanese-like domain-containing protein [Neisseriales bacterium]